jgi:c-di-GMP-binding flagellar brake protein YcgR
MDTEKRRYPRFECTGTGGIHITSEPPYFARVANLSLEGCLMVLQKPHPFPLDMTVELTFEVNRLPFRVRAQVRAVRSDKMIGFQFLQVSRRTQWQLEELIAELAAPIPPRPAVSKTRLS